jgi:hypothetical protein
MPPTDQPLHLAVHRVSAHGQIKVHQPANQAVRNLGHPRSWSRGGLFEADAAFAAHHKSKIANMGMATQISA